MREPRGASSLATLGSLFLALALAAPALAAPGSADLVVRGPVETEGKTSLVGLAGFLLLRDASADNFEDVYVNLPTGSSTVIIHRIQNGCDGVASRAASFAVGGLADRRSALDVLPGDVAGLVAHPLGAVTARSAADPLVHVPEPVHGLASHALDAAARSSAAVEPPVPLPAPFGQVACSNPAQGRDDQQIIQFDSLNLVATGASEDYALFWNGAADHHREEGPPTAADGTAILQSDAAVAQLQRYEETVRFIDEADPWSTWDDVASEVIPADLVRAEVVGAHGTLAGSGTLWIYGANVAFGGTTSQDHPEEVQTGTLRDERGQKFVQYVEVQTGSAGGSFRSPASVRLYASEMNANLQGLLRVRDASGTVQEGDRSQTLDRAPFELDGQFGFLLQQAGDGGSRNSAMKLQISGDVTSQNAGPFDAVRGPVATTAAAASVVALMAGALAYFWPAMKWLLAPLYTRIPTDALLLHEARERIYKLIKEEPGIHAHEIASRLDLGWGTAVYHLKLLERNGLVVARHEGRYKRFFVTGDQRIQRKEAVALLRNATSRSIAAQVAQQPGLIQKQVCAALGLSPSLASWHLQRLEAAHVVRAERLGRAVRYQPGPAWSELQELDALRAAAAAPVAAQGAA